VAAPAAVRYDTIRQKSLTWTRKLSIQLYLAHVARKKAVYEADSLYSFKHKLKTYLFILCFYIFHIHILQIFVVHCRS